MANISRVKIIKYVSGIQNQNKERFKMKNFKRVLAMATAATMAVTAFAGCSSNNATSGEVGGSTSVAEGEKTIVIGGQRSSYR